jgi:hypothetical protein
MSNRRSIGDDDRPTPGGGGYGDYNRPRESDFAPRRDMDYGRGRGDNDVVRRDVDGQRGGDFPTGGQRRGLDEPPMRTEYEKLNENDERKRNERGYYREQGRFNHLYESILKGGEMFDEKSLDERYIYLGVSGILESGDVRISFRYYKS